VNQPLSLIQNDQLPAPMTAVTPWAMLAQAIDRGMSPETVDKMMGLAERWEANQARKAFNEAFSGFKAEAVNIVRNRKVTDGPLKGKSYAELVSFIDAATPALSKHGLSASWDITRDEKDWIEVTCIVEHVLGGSKRVKFGGPPDAGPARNALQARVSTLTYLERATFKAATGLAEQGDDKDGNTSGNGDAITDAQSLQINDLIESVGADRGKFLAFFEIEAVSALPAAKFKQALDMLKQKAAKP
jgi:hypothetical protein